MTTAVSTATAARGRRTFADLSVNIKILAAVSIAVLAAVVVGIVGLRALSAASASADLIYSSNVASIKAVGQIEMTVRQARLDAANQALSQDAAGVTKYTEAFDTDLAAVAAAVTAYRPTCRRPTRR
ncbi:MCP four helix bundle domain-containing protein [Micromonosporaceae bacterium Da 78-11]